jgi:thioredoxin reductase
VTTQRGQYRGRSVILALGRRGTPRKLGVPGEELPKVMYSLLDAEAYRNAHILVVGGGDSAVEAALGLAHQTGNRVSLSYRGAEFTRLKARNAQRLRAAESGGKLEVIRNSQVVSIAERSVRLHAGGAGRELPNDYVWVFAGGLPPSDFLARIGVQVGPRDLTAEVVEEARLAAAG